MQFVDVWPSVGYEQDIIFELGQRLDKSYSISFTRLCIEYHRSMADLLDYILLHKNKMGNMWVSHKNKYKPKREKTKRQTGNGLK